MGAISEHTMMWRAPYLPVVMLSSWYGVVAGSCLLTQIHKVLALS